MACLPSTQWTNYCRIEQKKQGKLILSFCIKLRAILLVEYEKNRLKSNLNVGLSFMNFERSNNEKTQQVTNMILSQ